ncbi:MAG: hypothetical protein ABID04_01820 [Patescibacteria group bacterium]
MDKTPPKKITGLIELLEKLDKRKKHVGQEFQAYGLQLAEEMGEWSKRSMYIKLAKQIPREILEKARLFVKDQLPGTIDNKGKLFMWKLKELRNAESEKENS